jgi:YHS domain-containing protein
MKHRTTSQGLISDTQYFILLVTGICLYMFTACEISRATAGSAPIIDPVCNMKIKDSSEAFTWKYKEKVYYFDSNVCKESFKMNPEKFINNSCNQVK